MVKRTICLTFTLAAALFFASAPQTHGQGYTDAFLTSTNYNTAFPCGNTGTTTTQQIQYAFQAASHYSGGTVDLTCYQSGISITSDIFSPVSANILLWLPEHTVTVNANATIPSNFEICHGPGGSIVAGSGFTLTNNASACLSGASGGGTVTSVAMTGDGTVYNSVVNGSPITTSGTLAPSLKSQNANLFLAGPVVAVPGAAAVIQTASGMATGGGPVSVAFANKTTPGNSLIMTFNCIGYDNQWVSFSVADSQLNTFTTAFNGQQNGMVFTTGIPGGADTLTATFTYGAGALCASGILASALEVTNLAGTVDTSYGVYHPGAGNYNLNITTGTADDLLILFANSNNSAQTLIVSGTNPYTTYAQPGSNAEGWGVGGYSYSGAAGSYSATVNGTGGDNYGALVAFRVSGAFTPSAPPNFRNIVAQDLPSTVVENNQSNTYAAGTTQDFSAATALNLPSTVNATEPTTDVEIGNNTFRFDFTSSSTGLTFQNTTAATSVLNQSSPQFVFRGQYWNGAASAADAWNYQDVLGSGSNPTSTLTFLHSGSTGVDYVQFPNLEVVGIGNFSGSSDLYAPTSAGATGSVAGDLKYDSTNNNYHGNDGADAILAVLPASLSPTTNDCVKWTVTSGKISLGDSAAGCGGNTAWSNLGNPSADLTLSMTSFSTDFIYTESGSFRWDNTNAATSTQAVDPPSLSISGQYWNGLVSATDLWTMTGAIANGTNGDSAFEFLHAGSAGAASVYVPGLSYSTLVVSQLPTASTHATFSYWVRDSTTVAVEGQTCVGGSGSTAFAISNGSVWKCF